ncbi:MAG: hypothetical protein ACRC8S_10300 [Fimbriiglobus sp.]
MSSIVHATVQPRFDLYFEGWTGDVYQLNDSSGTSGVVVFLVDGAVGCFYDVHSPHSWEWLRENQDSLFVGMPSDLQVIARRIALQYLLQDIDGQAVPVVSAVFWAESGNLSAAVPWSEFLENGGHILRIQLLEPDAALAEWTAGYELTPEEVEFAQRVFEQKQAANSSWIELEESDAEWLQEQAETPEGLTQCRQSFAEIGILVP